MGVITYNSNNSGGSWWLEDEDWVALEAAGWVVHWNHAKDDPSHSHENEKGIEWSTHAHSPYDSDSGHWLTPVTPNGDRWMGALAKSAAKVTDDPDSAVAEFERVTKQNASDIGCTCCGQPHSFEFHDDDGNSKYYEAHITATEGVWS
jgi:hypothetical protein